MCDTGDCVGCRYVSHAGAYRAAGFQEEKVTKEQKTFPNEHEREALRQAALAAYKELNRVKNNLDEAKGEVERLEKIVAKSQDKYNHLKKYEEPVW